MDTRRTPQTRILDIDAKFLNKLLENQIQQHIIKITNHDQVGLISGMQEYHINRMKDTNHMVISIDAEKVSDKTLFIHDKTSQQIGIEGTHLNTIKAT